MTVSRPQHTRQRWRVLVAEDSAVNQPLAEAVLASFGHEVVLVADGEAALEALAADRYDAALLSVQLPGTDGLEATRRHRAGERRGGSRLLILGMAGHANSNDWATVQTVCLAAGMDGVVAKPLRRVELAAALDAVFNAFQRPADTGTVALAAPTTSPGEPPAPIAAPPDPDLAKALAMMDHQPRFLARMAAAALHTLPGSLAKAQQSLAAGDWGQLEGVAHQMKGALAVLVATAATESARELESAARHRKAALAAAALGGLETKTRALLPALEAALRPGGLAWTGDNPT